MSQDKVTASQGSIAIGGDAAGPVLNVTASHALFLAVTVEQRIEQQLPSFLGKVILIFSEQTRSAYGQGARREIPAEVLVKLKHNDFPPENRVICDFLRYSHLLETSYHGVEQRNSDARYLVRRKAGLAYDAEVQIMNGVNVDPIASLEYVRENATAIVTNVIKRLLQDYKSSCEVKVEQEIADLAISLIVADAIVECEVLDRPKDALPYADTSLYPLPKDVEEEALVMLSDVLPTAFERGVLNAKVEPGCTLAIVGAGPVGLAALLTAQFYSPARIIMIDLDDNRLQVARHFGATDIINSKDGNAVERVMQLTDSRGVESAIEAVGLPATYSICEDIITAGGNIAVLGVHGLKVDLHLERLWSHNITIRTRLVDTVTTPMLLRTMQAGKIDPKRSITHHFQLSNIMEAYTAFGDAAANQALKVILEA